MLSRRLRGARALPRVLFVAVAVVLAVAALAVPPAVAGTVALNPTNYEFGEVQVGVAVQSDHVLTNNGPTPTQVAGSIITGASAHFSASGCGTSGTPITLQPAETCTITVTFQPATVGAKTATLTVQHDGGNAATAALAGTAVTATADLSVTSLEMGEVELGSQVDATVAVANNGNGTLVLGDWSIAGDNGDFSSGSWCQNSEITPNSNCEETIHFAPAVIGSRSAELTIETNIGPRTVTLTGTGVDSVSPTVTLSDPTVPFTLAASTVLNFTGQDVDPGSGVVGFDLRKRTAPWDGVFGAWEYPAVWNDIVAVSRTVGLAVGRTTCFAARSQDAAGNTSPWSPGRCTARPLGDRSLAASAQWTRSTGSGFYLDTVTRTTTKGATLTRTSARLSRVALVVTKCPTCGSVAVYVGSTLVGKVNLARATKASQVLVVLPAFSLRAGTVTVKVLTSGKPVLIEGLGIFRPY